ncbi:unnamed protein product [Rotaria sp. Silwood1]|nr:unnamed protein product [Rotaria sp. Silwood1]
MPLSLTENISDYKSARDDIVLSILSPTMKFGFLLAFEIPSFFGYLFVIIYVLSDKSLQSAPNNYSLLIILILAFYLVAFHIPSTLKLYYQGTVLIQSTIFCTMWRFINFSCWTAFIVIMAWASIERHILIFHDRIFGKTWRNICFHYAPPIIIIIYMVCFYIYAIIFYPCEGYFDYHSLVCGFPCYVYYKNIALCEYIVHYICSIICIIIFNLCLVIHVLYSKRRLQQSINWRKHRKMIIQAVSISALVVIGSLPFCVVNLLSLTGSTGWTIPALDFCNYFSHVQPLWLPFVFMGTLPNIGTKFKRILFSATNQA